MTEQRHPLFARCLARSATIAERKGADVLRSRLVAGGGERVFADAAGVELTPVSSRTTPHVTHLVYRR